MIVIHQYSLAWSELGERDRAAIDLIEVQGLSYAKAGLRLHVGLSNMKLIMFRARRRIRARIAVALGGRGRPGRAIAV
jgi:DNA-directed RNA polymerase specialized sigma24 family protein